jgi:predicted molibdopterin-dependent oxidoreductase YjgC
VHPRLGPGYAPVEEHGMDTRAMLEAAAAGELDALVVFGADLVADFPHADLAERALANCPFTLVVEMFPTETAQLADVILPSAAYAERAGTFTNLERRVQKLEQLLSPPGAAQEPWMIAQGLAEALGERWDWDGVEDVWEAVRAEVPTHADVRLDMLTQQKPVSMPAHESPFEDDPSKARAVMAGPGGNYPRGHRSGAPFQTGQNWPLSWEIRAFEAKQRPGIIPETSEPAPGEGKGGEVSVTSEANRRNGRFTLYTGRLIYDEGAMVARTTVLRNISAHPFIEMNDEDVKELGIGDGDDVVVAAGSTEARLPVRVVDIARGAVFVPYDQKGFKARTLIAGDDMLVDVRPA